MKYLVWGVLALAVGTRANAVEGGRDLPATALVDVRGVAVGVPQLERSTPWVLLALDAHKPQAQAALARLHKRDGDWGGAVVVVASGSEAAFRAMVERNAQLAGVEWYRDADGALARKLGLPGLPAVLGIGRGNHVAWRTIGVPASAGRARSLVDSWLAGTGEIPKVSP